MWDLAGCHIAWRAFASTSTTLGSCLVTASREFGLLAVLLGWLQRICPPSAGFPPAQRNSGCMSLVVGLGRAAFVGSRVSLIWPFGAGIGAGRRLDVS